MNEKITVLLVEPGKYPKPIEIEDTLEAMQEVVGGDIEEYGKQRKSRDKKIRCADMA